MFHAIQLSKSDPTPLYIQLASELASLIQSNVLQEGFKLPTIRLLSKQLLINRDTVVSAYKLLEQQGLVESHIGKGTYIAPHKNTSLSSLSPQPTSFPQLCCSQLKFSSSFFPITLCHELTQKIVEHEGWEAFSDPLLRHRYLLKQSIASFLEDIGVTTHFAQIKLTSCLDEFLLSLFKFFPKTGICVESIRDLSLSCQLRTYGAKIYEVPLTAEGLDLDILEKYLRTGTISYIVVSPYLHNPTGLCYSLANKERLLALAEAYDCYIIEDGSYSDYLSPDIHYKPLYNLCKNNRVLYMYSFSKIYLPYLKYTFFVLPPIFHSRINEDAICSFNERFLHYYLDSDTFDDLRTTIIHLTRLYYHELVTALTSPASSLTPLFTHGGTFLWLKINRWDQQAFFNYLNGHHLIIAPGELFSTTPLSDYFRLSIGELTHDTLTEVIQILLDYSKT